MFDANDLAKVYVCGICEGIPGLDLDHHAIAWLNENSYQREGCENTNALSDRPRDGSPSWLPRHVRRTLD
jgi:hypothetical protein